MIAAPVSKLPTVGTTIFTVMSELARQHDAINLSQGFPDFEPPELLRARVRHHIEHGHNQYAPMTGIAGLRTQIAAELRAEHGATVDPDTDITITSGATEALFSTIAALVHSDDEVIVLDPAYDSYEPAVTLAGARTVHVPLAEPDYRIDFDRLRAALNDKTRLMIINTPHNPTGAVISSAELDALAALLEPTACRVLSDEVYQHIVFDGREHLSVLAHPRLSARSIAVFSFGKTYHATGWKIGYAVAPAEVTEEIRRVHQFNTFTTSTPMQWALADFMATEPDYPSAIAAFYQKKRDLFVELLADSGFHLPPSAGTYFQLAGYSEMSDRPDVEYARWLTEEIGVAAIPVSVFSAEAPQQKRIRFCFAKEDETLRAAGQRLCAI